MLMTTTVVCRRVRSLVHTEVRDLGGCVDVQFVAQLVACYGVVRRRVGDGHLRDHSVDLGHGGVWVAHDTAEFAQKEIDVQLTEAILHELRLGARSHVEERTHAGCDVVQSSHQGGVWEEGEAALHRSH